MNSTVSIKTPEEIALSRAAGQLAAEVLSLVAPHVKPGVSTEELDRICHDHIVGVQGAIPANIGYHGYPKTVCASVNHVVCHGIPSPARILRKGDIINIDVAVIKDGWYGDTSRMYFVGEPGPLARRLVLTTYEAMVAGIRAVRPGATLGDVGHAIQTVAHRERFSVVREYCGHGIGKIYHDAPQVLHYGRRGEGLRLEPGMVFHDRTDDQCRQARNPDPRRRLDGRHQGPFAVGPVGTHGGRHAGRFRSPDPLARRHRQLSRDPSGGLIRPGVLIRCSPDDRRRPWRKAQPRPRHPAGRPWTARMPGLDRKKCKRHRRSPKPRSLLIRR